MASMEKVKIVLINGSPRRYGWVSKLLVAVEKGVVDAGGEPELIHLYDYNIKPCIGCVSDDIRACRFPCIIDDDDFNMIGEKILEAHGLVIGTPIYWYSVSGLLKNFIDRLTSMENMIYHVGKSLLDGKVAGFIAVGNDTGAIMAIVYMMATLNSMGVHIPPWALAYHHSTEDISSNKNAFYDAYNVGYNIVLAAKQLMKIDKWYRTDIDIDSIIKEAEERSSKEKSRQWSLRKNIIYKSSKTSFNNYSIS